MRFPRLHAKIKRQIIPTPKPTPPPIRRARDRFRVLINMKEDDMWLIQGLDLNRVIPLSQFGSSEAATNHIVRRMPTLLKKLKELGFQPDKELILQELEAWKQNRK